MAGVERLSTYDGIFYHTDSDRVPMQANVAILVDGPLDYDAYIAWIRDRIEAVPPMCAILRPAPFHIRRPAWTPVPSFHVEDHVTHHHLPEPGDDDQFKTMVTEFIHQRLTLDRPLWHLHIINGLAGGRSALVLRWHHCMADAEGTLEILKALLETRPHQRSAPARAPKTNRAQSDVSEGAAKSSGLRRQRLKLMAQYARAAGPDLPFFRPVSGRVTIAWRHFPLADIQAIARPAGATVTDVILAALGCAVDRYAQEQHIPTEGTYLRLQVPANVRLPDKYGKYGNELAMLPGLVPLGLADPLERLRRVAAYNQTLKKLNMAAAILKWMGTGFGLATPPGQALMCRLMVSRPFLNLARRLSMPPHEHALLSSIVLPPADYTVQGRRVTSMVNFIACQFNMGFAASPVTYGDRVTLALTADASNLGDAETIIAYASEGIDELKSALE